MAIEWERVWLVAIVIATLVVSFLAACLNSPVWMLPVLALLVLVVFGCIPTEISTQLDYPRMLPIYFGLVVFSGTLLVTPIAQSGWWVGLLLGTFAWLLKKWIV